jgi:hypothetical protein
MRDSKRDQSRVLRAGDLARIVVPFPSVFETIDVGPTVALIPGEVVFLLKHESMDSWRMPYWEVIYMGRHGIVASRWLKPVQNQDSDAMSLDA